MNQKITHSKLIEGQVKTYGVAYLKQSNFPTEIAFSSFLRKDMTESKNCVAVFTIKSKELQ